MDGFNTSRCARNRWKFPTWTSSPRIIIPGKKKSFADLIRENAERAKGKKPYIIGEFGFVSTEQMADAMQAIADSERERRLAVEPALSRSRRRLLLAQRTGLGDNLYKAFHWPGSVLGDPYDEINLMTMVRSNAFAIRGLPVPAIPIPAAPTLLPITDAAAISWQGSVGASGYQVERAAKRDGDWQIIATNVDEAFTQYRPQFADENVPPENGFIAFAREMIREFPSRPISSAR